MARIAAPVEAQRTKFTAAVIAAGAIAALAIGRPVFVPLGLAALIAFALTPAIEALRRRHVGRFVSVAIAVVLASAVVAAIALFLTGQFAELAGPAPTQSMPVWIAASLAEPLVNPFASAGLAVVFAAFLLLHKEVLAERFPAVTGAGRDFGRRLLIQGVFDLTFGIVVASGLWAIGIAHFGLWALLGVMLRSVPFVGVAVAALCPSMIDPDLRVTAEMLVLFLATDGLLQLAERRWFQQSPLRLTAVAAVGATVCWTCLWGLTGLLLAMPLTLGAVMLGRHFKPLSFLDRLLAGMEIEAPVWTHAAKPDAALLRSDAAMRALAQAQHDAPKPSRAAIDETVAALAPQVLPPEEHAAEERGALVLCVAGPGVMDEAAAGLLAEALRRKGIRSRAIGFDETLPANLPRLTFGGIEAACISCLESGDREALLKLVRRLRPRLRHARIVAGLWSWDAGALMDSRAAECDLVTTHLTEAAERIAQLVHDAGRARDAAVAA